MTIPFIPPGAPGAQYILDVNGNPIGLGNASQGAVFSFSGPNGSFVRGGSNVPCVNSGSGGATNRTYAHAFSAWGDFNGVQLVYVNNTGAQIQVDNTAVCATSSIYPGGTNNIAVGAGDGTWSTPTGVITVAAGSAFAPTIQLSPFIAIESIPRAGGEGDGGIYPVLLVRSYINNASNVYYNLNSGMGPSTWNPTSQGFTVQANFVSGDQVTSPPGTLTTLAANTAPVIACFGAVFSYNQKMTSICGIGDSIMAGYNDLVTNNCPYGFRASAAVRAGLNGAASAKMVSWFNAGISGSTIQQVYAHGAAILTAITPDLIILASYTINSATATQANWDTQWQQVIALAQLQLAAGRKVLLMTPFPNNAFTSTTNAYRLKQRARVMNSGLPYCDVEAALVNVAGGAGNFINGLAQADGTHPNPAGHAAAAAVLAPVLAGLVGSPY